MSSSAPDPYRPPDAAIAETGQITDEELRAFAGVDSPYYLDRWSDLRNGQGPWSGPNFAALIFSSLWCFYRRMFWAGTAVAAATQAALIAAKIATVRLAGPRPDEGLVGLVEFGTIFVCSTVWCLLANHAYYRRAIRAVHDARRATTDATARLDQIRRAGGGRSANVLLGIVIATAVSMLVNLLFAIVGVGIRAAS